jgi:hypothetical protein
MKYYSVSSEIELLITSADVRGRREFISVQLDRTVFPRIKVNGAATDYNF